MRFLSLLLLSFFALLAYADDSEDFPPPPTSSMPNITSSSTSQQPAAPGTTSGGTFGSMVQTYTSQAAQAFQNVNYQKLSGAEDQNDFLSPSTSSDNPPNPDHLFSIFQENNP